MQKPRRQPARLCIYSWPNYTLVSKVPWLMHSGIEETLPQQRSAVVHQRDDVLSLSLLLLLLLFLSQAPQHLTLRYIAISIRLLVPVGVPNVGQVVNHTCALFIHSRNPPESPLHTRLCIYLYIYIRHASSNWKCWIIVERWWRRRRTTNDHFVRGLSIRSNIQDSVKSIALKSNLVMKMWWTKLLRILVIQKG